MLKGESGGKTSTPIKEDEVKSSGDHQFLHSHKSPRRILMYCTDSSLYLCWQYFKGFSRFDFPLIWIPFLGFHGVEDGGFTLTHKDYQLKKWCSLNYFKKNLVHSLQNEGLTFRFDQEAPNYRHFLWCLFTLVPFCLHTTKVLLWLLIRNYLLMCLTSKYIVLYLILLPSFLEFSNDEVFAFLILHVKSFLKLSKKQLDLPSTI